MYSTVVYRTTVVISLDRDDDTVRGREQTPKQCMRKNEQVKDVCPHGRRTAEHSQVIASTAQVSCTYDVDTIGHMIGVFNTTKSLGDVILPNRSSSSRGESEAGWKCCLQQVYHIHSEIRPQCSSNSSAHPAREHANLRCAALKPSLSLGPNTA